MKYKKLGSSDIEVSQLCLGSMTWGTQNTPEEAFEQIDTAMAAGVNFIDTAQMYPTTPLSAETQGRTEEIIGQWNASSGRRSDVILGTKVTGNGPKWIDDGRDIDSVKIRKALEESLQRLQTDYVDLYQLHWPNRGSYHFRQWPDYSPVSQDKKKTREHILDVLITLGELVAEGKVRTIGLSNESCWGTAQFLQIAEQENLPRVVSIQNEYSLMCRVFDHDLAELSHNENVGLLAFSPLAAGMLSGKYRDAAIPAGSRRSLDAKLSGRYSERSQPALQEYIKLADQHQIDPAQMALAFCLERPFMTSAIMGATTLQQLQNNLESADLTLSDELKSGILDIYQRHPIPM